MLPCHTGVSGWEERPSAAETLCVGSGSSAATDCSADCHTLHGSRADCEY